MSIYREQAHCIKCGRPMVAVCKDYSNYPPSMVPIGDHFLYWEHPKGECKPTKEYLELMNNIPKIGKLPPPSEDKK